MSSIFLCGFMGAGKSTVGRLLANRLGAPFFDTDELIVQKAQKSIPKIFADEGEARFRLLETEVLRERIQAPGCVVALGGGALLRAENRSLLKNEMTVYLRAKVETLLRRLENEMEERPLLAGLPPQERKEKVMVMLREREPHYTSAHFTIETDFLNSEDIASRISDQILCSPFKIGALT